LYINGCTRFFLGFLKQASLFFLKFPHPYCRTGRLAYVSVVAPLQSDTQIYVIQTVIVLVLVMCCQQTFKQKKGQAGTSNG